MTISPNAPRPNYSRDFCEPQYVTSLIAPDLDAVMHRRSELAAEARAKFSARFDIAYGATEKEGVDVYFAEGESRGVMVFIHGGYWHKMDKRDVAFLANSFVSSGITLVQVNYNLAPSVSLDEIVSEVRTACRWVWHNIDHFGGDRHRIYIGGNSAGGHLAAMMAATDWPAVDPTLPADLMKGGLAVSGIYDLEPLLFTSINDAVRMSGETTARNSPVKYCPTLRGPLLLPVGQLESAEFKRQTRLLAETWNELSPRQIVVPGRHHSDILLELADPDSELFGATLELMQLARPAASHAER
jgi:arylformamidase